MIDSKVFLAKISNLNAANEFLQEKFDEYNVLPKERFQLELAFEELFTNVANYSYGEETGKVEVGIGYEDDECLLVIKISDKGVPFNPLDKEEPDLTLNADDRPIGGLGIFMIKKNVDDIKYDYIDGENVVTLYKKI